LTNAVKQARRLNSLRHAAVVEPPPSGSRHSHGSHIYLPKSTEVIEEAAPRRISTRKLTKGPPNFWCRCGFYRRRVPGGACRKAEKNKPLRKILLDHI